MEIETLKIDTAIQYLKAGYHLYSIIDRKEERFFLKNGRILISSANKTISIDCYAFKNLYQNSLFHILDDSNEDTVDIKKDEEYYSWRQ